MRSLVALGVVLCAGLLAFLALSQSVDRPAELRVTDTTSTDGATGPRAIDVPVVRHVVVVPDASALEFENPLLVRVVDAAGPVAGATVRTLARIDPDVLTRPGSADARREDWEQFAIQHGESGVTDAGGEVRMPRIGDRSASVGARDVYSARAGDRYGESVLRDRDADVLEIRVDVDRDARVSVVDYRGAPVEGIRVRHRAAILGREFGKTERSVVVRTDRDGTARIPHLQFRNLAPDQVSDVSIHEPGIDLPAVPLDCTAPPVEPIRFVLPPTGRLIVRRAPEDPPEVIGDGPVILKSLVAAESFRATLDGDRAVFAHVGLGHEFEVTLRAHAGRRGPFRVLGPLRADEIVEFCIPPWENPLLRGRLVDADGTPFERTVLLLNVATDAGKSSRSTVAEEDGVFIVSLDAADRGRALRTVVLRGRFGESEGKTATIDGGDRRLEGTVDLGDITPELPPLWADGRCVDETGAPVSVVAPSRIEAVDAPAGAERPRFRKLEDGRFELRGGMGVGRVRIVGMFTIRPRAFQQEPVEIERGARDVRVPLARFGSLVATFTHLHGVACNLDVALHPTDGGSPIGGLPFPKAVDAGTAYTIENAPPGRYQFTATLTGELAPIITFDDVEIRPGPNADPRLMAIALPNVRRLCIELLGDDGALRQGVSGRIFVRTEDGWRGRNFLGRWIELLTHPGPVDVLVAVPGFRPIRRSGVQSDFAATLEALPTIPVRIDVVDGDPPRIGRFKVRGEPVTEHGEKFVVATAGRATDAGPAPWLGDISLAAGETGQLPVDGPGIHRLVVQWWVFPAPAVTLEGTSPATVTVPANGVATACTVRVPAATLRR